jgi:phage terminase Nu1 subunit (DNA packaging protein)
MTKPAKNMKNGRVRAATPKKPKATESDMTQAAFAEHVGISRQRVSRFVREGAIPTNPDGKIPHPAGLHAFVEHLCETAAGRGGGSAQAELAKERAALAGAQREAVELKNKAHRDDYVLLADVEKKWIQSCTYVRNRLLAIPSHLPTDLPHLNRAELSVIDRYIRDALTEIADESEQCLKENQPWPPETKTPATPPATQR